MSTVRELFRFYRRALLVAPLAVTGCREPAPGPVVVPVSSATDAAPPIVTPVATVSAVPTTSATAPKRACAADAPVVTGCGGASVALHDSLEACGLPSEGEPPAERCAALCAGFDYTTCRVYKDREGKAALFCNAAHPCLGRLPSSGSRLLGARADDVLEHLELARDLEALSVTAFRELEEDLVRWRAPASLVRACRRAARDEARHARAMARLLARRGRRPPKRARAARASFPTLEALARHNEREGVVGETWGALVALHQSQRAADEDVRAAMSVIAREEAEHAALSFRIARWARRRLGAEVAASLDDERRRAFAALRAAPPQTNGARALGWPEAPVAAAMLDVLAPLFA